MRDTEIIDDGSASGNPEGVDQTTLTRKFTEESITFITESHAQEKPFFLYLAHAMPHYPNYSSDDFVGSSQRGNYGDSVQEVDWSVGQIMQTLEDLGIEESTLVIFTSDNGPWQAASQVDFYGMGGDGTTGSALPLRGWKAQSLEGGMRVPCIMRFPGTIPAGIQSDKLATALDLLPTIAAYSGTTASLPTDRIIDGYDISAFLQNPDFIDTPNQYFFYYGLTNLEAVRDAEGYKLRTREETPELYFLPDDIHEDNNIADLYPDKVAELMAVMDAFDVEITQNARERGEAE
jgi:arylsulfatase A-like enzyme